MTEFENIFTTLNLENLSNYYIIGGDSNAKDTSWRNSVKNQRGIKLKKWIDDNDIQFKINVYSSKYPSFPRANSFMDLLFTDARLKMLNEIGDKHLPLLDYDSDHNALIAEIVTHATNSLEIELTNQKSNFIYKNANWHSFANYLNQHCNIEISTDPYKRRDRL